MKPRIAKFQIGKQGLTKEFIDSLELAFKKRRQVRVSVLKSCCRNREEIKAIALELQEKLPMKCKHRIIGFTLIFIKQ